MSNLETLVEFELARSIFPAALLKELARARGVILRVTGGDAERAVVRVRSDACSDEEGRQTVCERLTDAAMDYWAKQEFTRTAGAHQPDQPRRVDMALHLIEDDHCGGRILLTANPQVHHPVALLRALAPLRGRARIRMESTNPVDRFVITILLQQGDAMAAVVSESLKGL